MRGDRERSERGMSIGPPQTFHDLAPQVPLSSPFRWAVVDAEPGVEKGVHHVADRVDRDGQGRAQQAHQSATESRPERLRRGVTLVEPGVGRDKPTAGNQTRQQGLGGSEPEHREGTEGQQQRDQRPHAERPARPQHRDRAQGEGPTQAAPHQDSLAAPPVGVGPCHQSQHRVGKELSSVDDAHGERGCLQVANHQHGHRHGRDRRAERADGRRRPETAEALACHWHLLSWTATSQHT